MAMALRTLLSKSGKPSLSIISNLRKPAAFRTLGHLSSRVDWNPLPERVDNFLDLVSEAKQALHSGDGRHWLVILQIDPRHIATEQDLLLAYLNILAPLLGSEEEAKKKIYLASCELCFGFGAEIDQLTKYKLQVEKSVTFVLEDHYYDTRKKDLGVWSDPHLKMVDRKRQLHDLYSYHHLSAPILDCKSNYWLVHVTPPDSGFNSERETIEFCYNLLAEVVGSKEEAKEKIYIVWCKIPFGFAAEIDEETSNKLKGRPDVLMVLPDYAFDVNKKNRDVLVVSPPSGFELNTIGRYVYTLLPEYCLEDYENSDDDEVSDYLVKKSVDESPALNTPSTFPLCKHWFVAMKIPGGKISSWQERIDSYIKTLAIVVGSVEAAKEKIYRVKCEDDFFGFGAEIDEVSSNKLKESPGVLDVFPDYLFYKDHKGVDLSDGKAFKNTLEEMKMDFRGWVIQTDN